MRFSGKILGTIRLYGSLDVLLAGICVFLTAFTMLYTIYGVLRIEDRAQSDLPAWALNEVPPRKLENISGSSVYFWLNQTWKGVPDFCSHWNNFTSAEMGYDERTFRVYYPGHDLEPLKSRLAKLDWMMTFPEVQEVISWLKDDPEILVMDLSSQSTMFAMYAAMMGHQIMVVNPQVENILSAWKTIDMNGLSSTSTIFYMTPSGNRKFLPLRRTGLCNIYPLDQFKDGDNSREMLLPVTNLDNILPFVNSETVLMVMDGHMDQEDVFVDGDDIFHAVHVEGVLIERLPTYNVDKYELLKDVLYDSSFERESFENRSGHMPFDLFMKT